MRALAFVSVLAAAILVAVPWSRGDEAGDLRMGQATLQRECTRCHDLDRLYRVSGTIGNWQEILLAMSRNPDAQLSPEVFETLRALHVERQRALYAEGIFEKNCDECHNLMPTIAYRESPKERWRDGINRIRGGEAPRISPDEARLLVLWHLQVQDDLIKSR